MNETSCLAVEMVIDVELIDFFNCDDIAVQCSVQCSLYLLQFSSGF